MAKVKNKLSIEMKVSQGLLDLQNQGVVKDLVTTILKEVANYLVGRSEGITPMQSPIGRHFNRNNAQNYGFAPLSPEYAAAKKKKYGNKPILVRTGLWKKQALQGSVKKTAKGVVLKPNNPPPYAKYLEHGTEKMPARPAYTVNAEDEINLQGFIDRVVQDTFAELMSVNINNMKKVV